jgi:hypothetical protein
MSHQADDDIITIVTHQSNDADFVPPKKRFCSINSPSERGIFVAKVFGVVGLQLLATTLLVAVCLQSTTFRSLNLVALVWSAFVICIISMVFVIVASGYLLFQIFWVGIFTACLATMTAIACVQYAPEVVIHCLVITSSLVIVAVAVPFVTGVDLHSLHGVLYQLLIFGIIASIIFIFFPVSSALQMALGLMMILVFFVYIMVDTSDVIHHYDTDNTSVFLAAMNIYLDILNLFLWILKVTVLKSDC